METSTSKCFTVEPVGGVTYRKGENAAVDPENNAENRAEKGCAATFRESIAYT